MNKQLHPITWSVVGNQRFLFILLFTLLFNINLFAELDWNNGVIVDIDPEIENHLIIQNKNIIFSSNKIKFLLIDENHFIKYDYFLIKRSNLFYKFNFSDIKKSDEKIIKSNKFNNIYIFIIVIIIILILFIYLYLKRKNR